MQEENLDKSFALASQVQKNFTKELKRRDRGVRQAGFVVLYETYMPSVLIELGFLSNKKEGRYLNSKKRQNDMANSIAKAVKKYINQLRLNTVLTKDVVADENTDSTEKDRVEDVIDDIAKSDDMLFKIQIASSKKRIRTKS